MSRDDDPSYNDTHRAFLQAFMARGTLTFSEARPLLAEILSVRQSETASSADEVTESDFQEYITAISSAVAPLDLEIRSSMPQGIPSSSSSSNTSRHPTASSLSNSSHGGERVYALINGTSDSLTQLATTFTADEIAFVKRVLDDMFERNNTLRREVCSVSGKHALQLHSIRGGGGGNRRSLAAAAMQTEDGEEAAAATQGTAGTVQALSMGQAQTVLDALVAQGWLELSRKGFYSLAPRALMELRSWLPETYNDEDAGDETQEADADLDAVDDDAPRMRIKTCQACREIVTVGQRCPRLACRARLHDGCRDRFFTMRKEEKCPLCGAEWSGFGYVGERADVVGHARRSMNATKVRVSRQQRRPRPSGMDRADDDDDDGEDGQERREEVVGEEDDEEEMEE